MYPMPAACDCVCERVVVLRKVRVRFTENNIEPDAASVHQMVQKLRVYGPPPRPRPQRLDAAVVDRNDDDFIARCGNRLCSKHTVVKRTVKAGQPCSFAVQAKHDAQGQGEQRDREPFPMDAPLKRPPEFGIKIRAVRHAISTQSGSHSRPGHS